MDEADELVGTIPIQYTESLSPSLHLYQYPLLTRPLQVPPSAALSGKRIKARYKPKAARVEVQVPVDTRPEVWNTELGKELGNARTEEDKSLEGDSEKGKWKETEERRLGEVRMLGDKVPHSGIYMLGVVRSGTSLICVLTSRS
jgi:DNA-directed RNA polymerase-3 subunit RPC5